MQVLIDVLCILELFVKVVPDWRSNRLVGRVKLHGRSITACSPASARNVAPMLSLMTRKRAFGIPWVGHPI